MILTEFSLEGGQTATGLHGKTTSPPGNVIAEERKQPGGKGQQVPQGQQPAPGG